MAARPNRTLKAQVPTPLPPTPTAYETRRADLHRVMDNLENTVLALQVRLQALLPPDTTLVTWISEGFEAPEGVSPAEATHQLLLRRIETTTNNLHLLSTKVDI